MLLETGEIIAKAGDVVTAQLADDIQNMLQRILILFVLTTLLLFVSLFIKKRKKVQ